MTASTSKPLLWSLLGLILFASLSLLVVAAEHALRAIHPHKTLMFESDGSVIARFKADLDRPTYGSDLTHVRTNSFAFRDDEDFDPAQADVLVFGDSNIAALSLEFDDTFGEVLEDELGGRHVAANMGVPGYGPDQSLRRFLQLSDDSKARAVVFHVFADNDFGDMFRNSIYRISDAGIIERSSPFDDDPLFFVNRILLLRSLSRMMTIAGSRFTLADVMSRLSGGEFYSPFHQDLRDPAFSDDEDALEDWLAVSTREYEEYEKGRYTSWTADHYDYGIAADPRGEMASVARELMTYVFTQARSAFSGRDECMLVLIQPSENDLSGTGATVSRARLELHFPEYDPRTLTGIASSAARSAEVSYIDLYGVFAAAPGSYYFSQEEKPGDGHWNARGIATAARLVAAHLGAHRCLSR